MPGQNETFSIQLTFITNVLAYNFNYYGLFFWEKQLKLQHFLELNFLRI